jgi:hypothetical protein
LKDQHLEKMRTTTSYQMALARVGAPGQNHAFEIALETLSLQAKAMPSFHLYSARNQGLNGQ